MPPEKSISRSLGEFFGHIWKGVQEPVGEPAANPYLYMASKGQVQFPGGRDVHLDIIPVELAQRQGVLFLVPISDEAAE